MAFSIAPRAERPARAASPGAVRWLRRGREGRRPARPRRRRASVTNSAPAAESQCLQPALEVAVEPSHGHPGEIQRGGSRPAYVAHPRQHVTQELCLRRSHARLVGEARAYQGGVEALLGAHAAAAAVQGAAAAALGTEGLVTQRVVDHADEAAVGVLERDAHAPGGEAVEVVDRAVERVDHPAPAAVPGPLGALLAEHAVVRAFMCQEIAYGGLRGPVGLRHEVGGARLALDVPRRPSVALEQQPAGHARGTLG